MKAELLYQALIDGGKREQRLEAAQRRRPRQHGVKKTAAMAVWTAGLAVIFF